MKRLIVFYVVMLISYQCELFGADYFDSCIEENEIVTSTKRIYLPEYPGAHNPSLIKFNQNYILTFRYQPDRSSQYWVSYIGVQLLNENFEPIGKAQLLDSRVYNNDTPSQSEDARIFAFEGKNYLVFNDNIEFENPNYWERRDMYIAELFVENNKFQLGYPLRLVHNAKYRHTLWQKNWSPFIWEGNLMFSYSINPHEVLLSNLKNGSCQACFITEKSIQWDYGPLRGSTPAQMVDGEYLAFFHSGRIMSSLSSENRELWHYFMGAYTFSAEPPFELTSISPAPIDAPSFYTYSSYFKRVIYPGGFVVDGSKVYLAYGKDDSEMWIATVDLQALKDSMIPLQSNE